MHSIKIVAPFIFDYIIPLRKQAISDSVIKYFRFKGEKISRWK